MRLLYEIKADLDALLSQVDEETGELLFSMEDLEKLQMEWEAVLEGIALKVKNLRAEAALYQTEIDLRNAEIDATKESMDSVLRHADKLEKRLAEALAGEKMKTPRVAVSWRKTPPAVAIDPGKTWEDFDARFLRQSPPTISKDALCKALKAGEVIAGAKLVSNTKMYIK